MEPVARKGSLAKVGVVFLAPLALGVVILGVVVTASGSGLREHGPTPARDTWMMMACLVVAGLLFIWWIACIVRVWMTRERDHESIPRAKTVERR